MYTKCIQNVHHVTSLVHFVAIWRVARVVKEARRSEVPGSGRRHLNTPGVDVLNVLNVFNSR